MLPDALGPLGMDRSEPQLRSVRLEDSLARQIERILWIRSDGGDWRAALDALVDAVEGLQDDEFWDGIPDRHRDRASDPGLAASYAEYGWDTMSIQAFQEEDENGVVTIFKPSEDDLRKRFRCIMRLLARIGVTYKYRTISEIAPPQEPLAIA